MRWIRVTAEWSLKGLSYRPGDVTYVLAGLAKIMVRNGHAEYLYAAAPAGVFTATQGWE